MAWTSEVPPGPGEDEKQGCLHAYFRFARARLGPEEGLRWALFIGTAAGFWAALHFGLATRTLKAGLARAQGEIA